MEFRWLAVLGVLVLSWSGATRADTITVVTEETYPLSYLRDGKIAGQATALIEETFRAAGMPYKIEMLPWARAYNMALSDKNVLIYSLARTTERESQFKWVGEIAPLRFSFYKLRSRRDISIKTLDDAKKYRIGVVKDDLRAKYLIEQGFTVDAKRGLQEVSTSAQNLPKILNDRIDLVPMSQIGIEGLCRSENVDCAKFEPVFDLGMRTHLYMAFSKQTPDDVVERLRKAYDKLASEGVVRKLLSGYWD